MEQDTMAHSLLAAEHAVPRISKKLSYTVQHDAYGEKQH